MTRCRFLIITLALTCCICVAFGTWAWRCASSSNALRSFRSSQYGIALLVPSNFTLFEQQVMPQTFEFGDMKIEYVRFGVPCRGECPYLFVSRESIEEAQPRMSRGRVLSLRSFYGAHVIRLDEDGMGSPTSFFLRHDQEVVSLEFGFPPSEEIMRTIVQSVRLDEDIW